MSEWWHLSLVSLEEQAGFGKTKQKGLCGRRTGFKNTRALLGSQWANQSTWTGTLQSAGRERKVRNQLVRLGSPWVQPKVSEWYFTAYRNHGCFYFFKCHWVTWIEKWFTKISQVVLYKAMKQEALYPSPGLGDKSLDLGCSCVEEERNTHSVGFRELWIERTSIPRWLWFLLSTGGLYH